MLKDRQVAYFYTDFTQNNLNHNYMGSDVWA